MLDVSNKDNCLMDVMDAAMGPSVPFVRRYLEHIKELHVKRANKPHPTSYPADAGPSAVLCRISTLLRHQSSPYSFEITKSIRRLIGDELQTVWLAND